MLSNLALNSDIISYFTDRAIQADHLGKFLTENSSVWFHSVAVAQCEAIQVFTRESLPFELGSAAMLKFKSSLSRRKVRYLCSNKEMYSMFFLSSCL